MGYGMQEKKRLKNHNQVQEWVFAGLAGAVLVLSSGCSQSAAKPQQAQQGGQAMPVKVQEIALAPVPVSDEYVSTIKSRRSATLQPQVDGKLIAISVHSGDHVKAGQVLMEIDPLKQQATVGATKATELQKLAVYQYNQTEVDRQRKLFEAGVTSRETFDQADQAFKNSKADYESTVAATKSQEEQLKYYRITAPFTGIVGDVPVHLGDYVSASTVLTTVDENAQLEAYIYIPTARASQIRIGLPVEIRDTNGDLIEKTSIKFISPQVDNGLQGILAKADVKTPLDKLRTAQLVKARVIWSTSPAPLVPVLAISRIGGQSFVYTAEAGPNGGSVARQKSVQLGDTIGNQYVVQAGLAQGNKVILSGIQFLVDGAPVQPLPN